jgi:hypothetical protein
MTSHHVLCAGAASKGRRWLSNDTVRGNQKVATFILLQEQLRTKNAVDPVRVPDRLRDRLIRQSGQRNQDNQ